MIADTTIRTGEAVAMDVVLHAPPAFTLAYPPEVKDGTVILTASETEAQAEGLPITVTWLRPTVGAAAAPAEESKLKRWSGTEWVRVGTLIVKN